MLQDIWSNNRLFGGLPNIIGGDFAQISGVFWRGIRVTIVRPCI